MTLLSVFWDCFFWLWYNIHIMHNKLLYRFFSNKAFNYTCKLYHCLKNKHCNTLRVWLYEKEIGSLRRIFHSRRCCWYARSVFTWSRRMTRLQRSRPSKQNGMNKNRYELFSQPVETKIIVKWLHGLHMIEAPLILCTTLLSLWVLHNVKLKII